MPQQNSFSRIPLSYRLRQKTKNLELPGLHLVPLVFIGGFPALTKKITNLMRTDETPANCSKLQQQPSIKTSCFFTECTNKQVSLEGC